jgi:alpha-glucosidase
MRASERYAATWTGDNSSTWNHMRISIPQLLNLGLSGYTFSGDDIGGFAGESDSRSADGLEGARCFQRHLPKSRDQGQSRREPWVDGPEQKAIRRHYIETRYQLLPYIYTETEEASRTGIPVNAAYVSGISRGLHVTDQRKRVHVRASSASGAQGHRVRRSV